MTYEEIEMLGLTIHRRLGKRANALWQKAKRDLVLIEIIKNHISRELKFDIPKEIKAGTDYSSSWVSYWYEYISKKANEEEVIFITEWLRNNINKDILREWLDDELDSKELELKAYKRAYEWKCNGVKGTYEELLDKAKKTIIADEKSVKGVNVE